jgi:DcaP outer membrane protein
MRTPTASPSRRPLATALLLALLAPGVAFAETAKEKELEARVAQLEQQVQALLASQQQQQAVIAEAQTQITEVKTVQAAEAARVPAGKQRIQAVSITPGAVPGTTFKVGGFIKADFLATQTSDGQLADDATARALYLPGQTPVGGSRSGVDGNAHAKFSRFNLGVDSVTDGGDKMGAFMEMDFFGGALGNQAATNTYGVTLRHAYMYWNNWLAGQTWSNFMDVGALPEAVDFIGPTDGVIFVRQAQLRYTRGGFSAALENSETTLVGTTSSDRGAVPDLTLRYGWKGDWGTFGVAALAKNLKVDRPGYDDSSFGGGITLGGKWLMGSKDTLHYQLTGGEGIARYIGLGVTGDAVLDASDGSLDTTGVLAGYVGWRHAFNPKLRTNVIFARSDYDNDAALTGLTATRSVQSVRANVFYSPLPKVDVGAELMFGTRELESGAEGDITRLQLTTKYSF